MSNTTHNAELAKAAEIRLVRALLATGGENPFYPDSGATEGAFRWVPSGSYFSNRYAGAAWDAIVTISGRGEEIDPVAVCRELLDGDYPFDASHWAEIIADLSADGYEAQHWRVYAGEVQAAQIARLAHKKVSGLADGGSVDLDALDDAVTSLREMRAEVAETRQTAQRVVSRFIEAQEENWKNPGIKGACSGIAPLDRTLGGLLPGRVVVVAARPSVGKTAAAVTLMRGLLKNGHACEFVSLEMSEVELMTRLVAQEARCSFSQAGFNEAPSEGTRTRILNANSAIYNWPMAVHSPEGMTINDASAAIRRAGQLGAEVVFVDYLGLLKADTKAQGESRYLLTTEASVAMKTAARKAGVCVVLLVQLKRETDKSDAPPKLSDLRESSQIEQDADSVVFVHRPDKDEQDIDDTGEECAFVVAKNRNGPTGKIPMRFARQSMTFLEE